ncbi:MAG: ribonuclease E/G [Pseudomonadota bacterium]
MTEWLIEEGIAETRALLVKAGEPLAAALTWPGEIQAGAVVMARLSTKRADARRGIAALDNGAEVLIDHLPREITQGERFALRITRAAIAERGRLKRPQARYVASKLDSDERPSGTLFPTGTITAAYDAGMWEEVWHAASSGKLDFAGGAIICSVTPAMTVIDIDGDLPPRELALAAIPAISRAIRWFDLGGNIGIDFPTIENKAERRVVDDALQRALEDWPHERTAMNGFGFVQIVARLEAPSLLNRFATSRVGMCARYALRVGERAQGHGSVLCLTVHPALKAKLKPDWIEQLAYRSGRAVRMETDPGLALEAPHAQILQA